MTASSDRHLLSWTTAAESVFSSLPGQSLPKATEKRATTQRPKRSTQKSQAPEVEKAVFAHIR
ncbi:MAG: hypothetical protein KIT86_17910, partial [Hydrogenophaga sp.]|uniref:hypothetical protein n=1 Tax=Hydrogenophaga sp. TaxID=1904254 RepID=UPI0026022BAF